MSIKHIAIIGFGNMGLKYFKILKKINKSFKITIVRSKGIKNKKIQNKADNVVYNINHAIKKRIDCALICTPSSEHTKQALVLAKNKIPFFVEKPISNSLENLNKLINLTKKNKIHAQVGYVLKELKSYKILKKKIDLNKVLSVYCEALSYLPKWKNDSYTNYPYSFKKLGGGALLELSHEIDYIRNIFGEIEYVTANCIYSKNLKTDVESGANLILSLKNKIIVNLILNFDSKILSRKCRINYSNKYLIWDIAKDVTYSKEKLFKRKDINYIYKKQIYNFLKNVKKNKNDHTTLLDSIKTLRVIKYAIKSHKLNKKLKII